MFGFSNGNYRKFRERPQSSKELTEKTFVREVTVQQNGLGTSKNPRARTPLREEKGLGVHTYT